MHMIMIMHATENCFLFLVFLVLVWPVYTKV
jgi:hypothetical protein